MAFYKKLPIVVEAFQLGIDNIPDWFMDKVSANEIITYSLDTNYDDQFEFRHITCDIKTLEGIMHGDFKDFIIKGVKGEIYPCKPDIFEKTYEKVT